tara:strand:- start:11726 stop:12142 length:417 start_codon:yes stop_codon:yes gene_type:complete
MSITDIPVSGTVIHGHKRGKMLGVPTANIDAVDALLNSKLTFGVYAVVITIESGKVYNGVANFGVNPTFNNDAAALEVHLFDFKKDLYGSKVSIEFRKFIRPEICFDDVNHLKEQLHKDLSFVRKYFSNKSNHLLTED